MKNTIKRISAILLVALICISQISLMFMVNAEEEADKWDGSEITIGKHEENIIEINKASDLAWLATLVNNGNTLEGYIVNLKCNIDLDNKMWKPIGKSLSTAFKGTFNGNGHYIKNIYVNVSIDSANILNAPYHTIGLFGICFGAKISNLTVKNSYFMISSTSGYSNDYSSINGNSIYAGAICGYAKSTVFEGIDAEDNYIDVYTDGEAGGAYAGGICGYNENGFRFSFCNVSSGLTRGKSVSLTNNSYVGGIVGFALNDGVINSCYNAASVVGGHTYSETCTGGIVGKTDNTSVSLSSIIDCYNSGTIYHEGDWLETGGAGGIAGYSYSTISRCYNSGSVLATTNTVGGDYCVGGIAGTGKSAATITNCAVMSAELSGGTKNNVISSSGAKTKNVAISNISGSPSGDSASRYGAESFFDKSLYETTLGWDFSNVWKYVSGEYPKLYRMDETNGEDINIVLDCISRLAITFAEGDYYEHVTRNVGLPKSISYDKDDNVTVIHSVLWESSNDEVVDTNGTVTATKNDTLVKLTAKITSGTYSASKTFVINVLGSENGKDSEPAYWAMSLDDARGLMALVRGCKFKDVSADDPDVLVLTGQVTDEQSVITTMSKVIEFWEIPCENSYLRSQLGDVIGMLKSASNSEINSLLSSMSGGLVKYDDSKDEGVINEKNVLSKLLSIPNSVWNVKINVVSAYNSIKGLEGLSFDPGKDFVDQYLDNGKKIFNFTDLMFKAGGKNVNLGKWSTNIKHTYDLWQLARAYSDAKKNAVKNYLKNYINNRGKFSSPDDETFKLLMAMHVATSINTDMDNISDLAECIYLITEKFCKGLDDEYKVVIKCPVDVSVYDSKGNIVGCVKNNVVDRSIMNSLRIEVGGENNDEKTIYIEDEEEYTLILTGNDSGEMDVSIGYQNDSMINDNSFESIPLENGKKMITTVSAEDIENNDIKKIETIIDGAVSEEYETVDEITRKYLFDVIDVTESLDGTISVSDEGGVTTDGYFSEKADISNLCSANYGYVFTGYYTDAACQNAYSVSSMPANNVLVYAKYTEVNPEIQILKQPCGGNYLQGDVIDALETQVNVPAKYTVDYQWYMIDSQGNEMALSGATERTYIPVLENCGTYKFYVKITATDANGVMLTSRSNTAVINISEHKIVEGGICGENLTWTYYENKELLIEGSGNMKTFASETEVPWKKYVSAIEKITFKGEIASVSSFAFAGMTSLTELVIPDSVTNIGENALRGCSSLKKLSVPFVGASRNADKSENAVLGYIFGKVSNSQSGVVQFYKLEGTSLSGYKYGIPASLKEIHITDAKNIPFGAFYNCSGITEIVLNEGITKISEYSFENCSSLKALSIPESVQTIEEYALSNCSSLEELEIPFVGSTQDAEGTYDAVFGHIFGRTNSGVSQVFAFSSGSIYSYYYNIPATLKKVTVTNDEIISTGAFSNCTNLKEIVLENATEKINEFAFYNIKSIDKLVVLNKNCTITNNYNSVSLSGTIYGYNGSSIQTFADKKSILFVILDESCKHDFCEWKTTVPSTCSEEGTEKRVCGACGETETRAIPVLGHSYSSNWTVDKEATCKENGSKSRHCIRCEAKTDVVSIAKLTHPYGNWTETVPSTCSEEGTEKRVCGACGETETRAIPVLGHSYSSNWTVDKEATCKENGSKSRHCIRCEAKTDVVSIAKLIHPYGNWTETVPSTCSEEGTEKRVCGACGETETRAIPVLGHSYSSSWTVDKEATCKENGSKSRHCQRCNSVTDITVITKFEHVSGDWIYVEATENESEKYVRYCSLCGDIVEEQYIEYIEVTSVSLNKEYTELCETDEEILVATVLPENASDKKLIWSSSNSDVATVDSDGRVLAVSPGTATVTVTTNDGGYTASCNVVVQAKEYMVTWVTEDTQTQVWVRRGDPVSVPSDPVKEGYVFKGWTPEIPSVMPGYDMVFVAVFDKAEEPTVTVTAKVSIRNNPGSSTVNYGDILRLTAVTSDMPASSKIYWFIDNEKVGEGNTLDVRFESGTKDVTVKIVDENGSGLIGADGKEISDSQSVSVKSGFFQKIISFFKNLFGVNRVNEQ